MLPRQEPRIQHRAPVRVFGIGSDGRPVSLTASTTDISRNGARLCGVSEWTTPGETIGVRCGSEKARFRIAWVGAAGSAAEGQIGILSMEPEKYIWEVQPPAREATPGFEKVAGNPVVVMRNPRGSSNRRTMTRYRMQGGAKAQRFGDAAGQWSRIHDISAGGCYLETAAPFPVKTRVTVTLRAGENHIVAEGQVTTCDHMVGMGVKFTAMTHMNRRFLDDLLMELTRAAVEI